MFGHRAGQFVGRHGWPLRLDAEGLEIDEYDDGRATYCVVEEEGRHLASVRLRPAAIGVHGRGAFSRALAARAGAAAAGWRSRGSARRRGSGRTSG